MSAAKTPEERARTKRAHATVMMILGAIMAACALAAGLIALRPGAFPAWMSGRPAERAAFRRAAAPLVAFAEFGPAVLERARRERRLVLLHLTAFWSRDGRVMEETVYSDPAVAAWVGAHALAARADADERPDLAARYGVGAWPSTLLLLPDGRPVAGAAFLTPKLFLPWARLIEESLRADPRKAEVLAERWARRPRAREDGTFPGREDPVWGGIYGGRGERGSGGAGFEKTLSDQARFVSRSRDPAAIRRTLAFVERFLSLPGGGYAASMRGEAETRDGRIAEGAPYFALDDAGRRAIGLPAVDSRVFPGPNLEMARAASRSPQASAAQKRHARRTLKLVR